MKKEALRIFAINNINYNLLNTMCWPFIKYVSSSHSPSRPQS